MSVDGAPDTKLRPSLYSRRTPAVGEYHRLKLRDVNTRDIGAAIHAGIRTMACVFDADDNDIPFFRSEVWPDPHLAFSPVHSEAHVPGRHLNALLTAESLGFPIDEAAIGKHAQAAYFSYGGPLPVPLNRARPHGPLLNFRPHNAREGLHALYALARFRDSVQARELAEASIAAILELWDPDDGWNARQIEGVHGLALTRETTLVRGLARAIGPLVKYFRATGHGPALELAIRLKNKVVSDFFLPDGSYHADRFGPHTHSTTCVMSSLAQLADLLGDAPLMERARAFYARGLWDIRDQLGWVIENDSPDATPDLGEVNNTGDILETALILGRWGHPEAYDDAERILRGHLLPSQLRDVSWIADSPDAPAEDGCRDVANRHRGAFGFPAPYGHKPVGAARISFNMDVVGGAVASLCEAYRDVTRHDATGHWINLLFDHETDHIQVDSPYTGNGLTVMLKQPGPLWVRMPSWANPARVEIAGTSQSPVASGCYLFFAEPPVGRRVTIALDLPTSEIVLRHRTHDIPVRLCGDEVVAMENFGQDLTFFDPID